MIIAGDIGGTKTNVALIETDGQQLGSTVVQKSYPSGKYGSLESILAEFVADAGCGYGGFAAFVASQAPALHVDGYTLSDVQQAVADDEAGGASSLRGSCPIATNSPVTSSSDSSPERVLRTRSPETFFSPMTSTTCGAFRKRSPCMMTPGAGRISVRCAHR